MSTRDAYIEKYKARLDLINADITRLEAKANLVKADAKVRYEQELASLRQKRDKANAKFSEIKNASGEAWQSLQHGAEDAWKSISDSVKDAIEKFK